MCAGDDRNCPDFELHRQQAARRSRRRTAQLPEERIRRHRRRGGTDRRRRVAGLAGRRPDGRGAAGQAEPSLRAGDRRDRPLGLFQQAAQAGRRDRFRRLRHHRNVDPSCQRRRRAHGQGRSGRRERLLVDQGQEGREPARRRSDRRQTVGPRRRRRASACTSAPARSMCAMPSRATSSNCGSWT